MPDASANAPLRHIRERRRQPHAERTFERRSSGDEDVRVIRKFEDMGAEKVRAILSRVGFGIQNNTAKQWLESQGESRSASSLTSVSPATPEMVIRPVVPCPWGSVRHGSRTPH